MYDGIQAREFTVARNALGAAIAAYSARLAVDPDPAVVAAKRELALARRGLGVLDRDAVRAVLAAGHRAWAPGEPAHPVRDPALTGQQVRDLFRRDIRPRLAGPARDRPTVVFIGGQTAAGKTTCQQVVLRDLGLTDVVPIDGDDLLDDHPGYRDAARADDRTAASLVGAHTSAWWTMTVEHLRAHDVDVVVSAPLGRAPWSLDRFRDFHAAGYRVELVLLAVPPAQSLLSLVERWHRDRQPERHGFGRWVAPTTHDRFLTGILETADAADASDAVDAIHVARRGRGIVYGNDRVGKARSTREVIETERARPWSDAERADFTALTTHLTDSHNLDARPLPPDLIPLLTDAIARGRA
ncbi:zeta toxin family protein [Embleya sp. NBC_00896]|uniref:zeta toxin family protein n=1 Tax=Embleya sp. NBC_00896 TaxID=2975961 RepID=UPI003864725D|nr:zeta toxin family protein [Embleya sp. NBC_00896]